ncbi:MULTISPECIES: hypothetical protein [Protofrankia]|uniref:amino acid kinase family protein n=1 Tax=Protofrankia TaxID=2994361 RepID=UPI00069ACA66|nr:MULTISPECIES: hypothetical protein [Protofrankia]ONH33758.1 hypothetical protein BL254_19385 [Protofrankia sp. BMG5.30]
MTDESGVATAVPTGITDDGNSDDGDVLVLKFGGAAFAAAGAHRAIARHVTSRLAGSVTSRHTGDAVGRHTGGAAAGTRTAVVVVSAAAGVTDRLGAALRAVSASPDRDLLAATLMTGETINVQLMTAALRDAGLAAVALTAADTGFLAGGEPHHADLHEVDARALTDAAARATVLVLPGGQASGPDGRPVMLGRNSSDLSAIAAAIALGAPACEIFSDSPGICTADPQLVPEAHTLPRVDYQTMTTMSVHGAKVLHHSAVAWARRHGVEIRCRSLLPDGRVHSVVSARASATAAVMAHRNAAVWAGRAEQVRSLLDTPRCAGSDLLVVPGAEDGADVTYLVLADTARDLSAVGLARRDLQMVTTLFPDGRLDRHLVPAADVPALPGRSTGSSAPESRLSPPRSGPDLA